MRHRFNGFGWCECGTQRVEAAGFSKRGYRIVFYAPRPGAPLERMRPTCTRKRRTRRRMVQVPLPWGLGPAKAPGKPRRTPRVVSPAGRATCLGPHDAPSPKCSSDSTHAACLGSLRLWVRMLHEPILTRMASSTVRCDGGA